MKSILILSLTTSAILAGSPSQRCSIDTIPNNPKGGNLNNPQRLLTGTKLRRNNIDYILAHQDQYPAGLFDPKENGTGPISQNTIDVNINNPNRTNADFIGPAEKVTIPGIPEFPQRIESLTTKAPYHLFNPTPDHALRDLSPDRPDATESPLTIDAGRFALEASLFDYRRDSGHETFTYGQLNFKAGLSLNTDFQTLVDLYSDGEKQGFGDVTLRLKHNLRGNDGGDTALALMPFVKIPTDTAVSNNEWEGGLIIPWSTTLTDTIGLGLMAEFDYLFNEDTGDHEFEFLHTAVLGFEVTEKAGTYLEYIGIAGEDHYRAYLAGGMNYAVNEHLILDFGAQAGLNKHSEDFGFFTGFTKRF